jgi:deoxyribodipyrimidine photo-lyase
VPEVLGEARAGLLAFSRAATPYGRARDLAVCRAVEARGARTLHRKDRVCFEAGEVRTAQGGAFSVYSPYRNAWRRRLAEDPQPPLRLPRLPPGIPGLRDGEIPNPSDLLAAAGTAAIPTAGEAAAERRLHGFLESGVAHYASRRDLPGVDGTSRLSAHLRFGCLSVRQCLAAAREAVRDAPRRRGGAAKWVDELVWREFYAAVLSERPHVARRAFRPEYDRVRWNRDPEGLRAWCEGRTGYPIVDAGMRQLAASGWMHNRVRMIAASFLVKDLLIDWREGERWFFRQLVDGDPASNNGGWQWAASTGTDPQPWFRIFNPTAQGQRFDPRGDYVRRWVPELRDLPAGDVHAPWARPLLAPEYPQPIVSHEARRREALERFAAARAAARGRSAGPGEVP